MRCIVTFVVVFLAGVTMSLKSMAQVTACDTIYKVVEEMPVFEGGNAALYKFMIQTLKVKRECRPMEKIIFAFVIDKKGIVADFDVVMGLEGECKVHALDQLSNFPPWRPGKHKGEAVCVKMILPMHIHYSE